MSPVFGCSDSKNGYIHAHRRNVTDHDGDEYDRLQTILDEESERELAPAPTTRGVRFTRLLAHFWREVRLNICEALAEDGETDLSRFSEDGQCKMHSAYRLYGCRILSQMS
jgi:hypothetical protein